MPIASQVNVGSVTPAVVVNIGARPVVVKHTTAGGVVYLGGAAVTAATGWPLGPNDPYRIDIAGAGALYGITAAGNVTVFVLEV